MWATTIMNCSFRSTDLRCSGLGGARDQLTNTWENVDFTRADFREISSFAPLYANCRFSHTRLGSLNFHGSRFTGCSFEGELREVRFWRKMIGAEALPPNEMSNVDFTGAELRWVEFHDLDLDSVRFPSDTNHILLDDYPHALDRILTKLGERNDTASGRLARHLGRLRKRAGQRQRLGVLNKNDLLEVGGEEGLQTFLELAKPPLQ